MYEFKEKEIAKGLGSLDEIFQIGLVIPTIISEYLGLVQLRHN